jgi:hypothetical protein
LSAEPQPGTDLQRRGETLPDVSVAHRAGSIVSEFVSSIVDEAEARGSGIIAEAQEEVRSQLEAAAAGTARIHEQLQTLVPELAALLETLRREAAELSGEPASETTLPAPMTPAAGGDQPPFAEATVMDEEWDEHDAGASAPTASPDQNGAVADGGESEEPHARVARMTDEELGRTYTNAVRALEGTDDGEYAASLTELAQAAVEEALGRPAFSEEDPEPRPGLGRRPSARKRRRRAVALGELRAACRQAREHELAPGPPGV